MFTYINDTELKKTHGFIAQEINNEDLLLIDNVDYYSIDIAGLIAPLIQSIKDLDVENKEIENEINNLIVNY